MTPKPRKLENRKLPARWRHKHGAYYYRVPPGLESEWDGKTEYHLGRTLAEAYRTWAVRFSETADVRTMSDLLDRYARETVPLKAPKTQESNLLSIRRLRPVFGKMPASAVKPRHAYKYRDEVTKLHGPASANRDLEVLSHSLSKAVEWGLIDRNPVKGQVRKNRIPRRERYIENWELEEALKHSSPLLTSYILIKVLTGLRRGDLLRLQLRDLKKEGIEVKISKTGKKLLIEWSPELRSAIDSAIRIKPNSDSPWLFCTRNGKRYVDNLGNASAFNSLWRRFMTRLLNNSRVTVRFQEKDLRKKTASDMTLEAASKLLGHNCISTTQRHYRLSGETVKPHTLAK